MKIKHKTIQNTKLLFLEKLIENIEMAYTKELQFNKAEIIVYEIKNLIEEYKKGAAKPKKYNLMKGRYE